MKPCFNLAQIATCSALQGCTKFRRLFTKLRCDIKIKHNVAQASRNSFYGKELLINDCSARACGCGSLKPAIDGQIYGRMKKKQVEKCELLVSELLTAAFAHLCSDLPCQTLLPSPLCGLYSTESKSVY